MRRLSSISQCPSSRAAATAWSSPQIVRRDAGLSQCNKLGDRVVFAIAGAIGEGDQRRTPNVDLAILGEIAHRPDRKIDRAIDLAKAGTSLAGARGVDDGEKLQGSRRHAALAVAVAKRHFPPLVVDFALAPEPFFPQAPRRQHRSE